MVAVAAIWSGCAAIAASAPVLESPLPASDEINDEDELGRDVANSGIEADLGNPVVISHHWLALKAIENHDEQVAIHHVEHVMALVTGSHVAQMAAALTELEDGRLHDASDRIKTMLAGTADPVLSEYRMHLELALFSLDGSQVSNIEHHFEHLLTDAPDSTIPVIENAMKSVAVGDISSARVNIEYLLAESVDADIVQGCIDPTRDRPESSELNISLLAEQGWIEEHGGTDVANFHLRRLAAVAARSLAEIGIILNVENYGSFSIQTESPARQLSTTANGDADLAVLLVQRSLPGDTDGWLDRSGNRIVIENKDDDVNSQALLLAHEIGHFYSLDHRTGTIMQPHGFPLVGIWSSCQRNFMSE